MPITILKKTDTDEAKLINPEKAQEQDDYTVFKAMSGMVDDMAELSKDAQKLKTELNVILDALKDKEKAFKKLFNSSFEDNDARKVYGQKFRAVVGKKSVERKIKEGSLPKMRLWLNKAEKGLFDKLAAVPLGQLTKYLTPMQLEKIIDESRGDRKIKYEQVDDGIHR